MYMGVKIVLAFAVFCLWCLPVGATTAQEVRNAAVSGLFYARHASKLSVSVHTFLNEAHGKTAPGKIRALVSPHAGYLYSGIVAAAGYRQIDNGIKKVVLLGPSHRVPLNRPSIADVKAYETPLGRVPLAPEAARLRNHSEFTTVSQAHEKEHSLEVQLPFLQTMLGDFDIIPILTNQGDPETLADLLLPVIDEETLVVASSDLSHYYSYDTAVSLDRLCTDAVVSGNVADMAMCQACGKEAMLTLMHMAEKKGWQAVLLDYKNSGDTAGDKNRVVGYTSIAFVDGKKREETMHGDLSDEEKKALLTLARSVIASRLTTDNGIKRPQELSSAMVEERGCFVTLHKQGRLRGCIGTIEPVSDLLSCVEENAQNAAFRDPRFPSLKKEELADIDIEISVLTVPKEVHFTDGDDLKRQLEPLTHGVILSRGHRRSTFLPQVWKQLPDKEAFLEHLCIKGGLAPQAWKNPKTEVKTYQAEVFGELDFE